MWLLRGAAIATSLVLAACGDSASAPAETMPGELILPPAATPVNFTENDIHQQDADYAAAGLRVLSPDFAVVDMAVRTQDAFHIESGGAVLEFLASTNNQVLVEEDFVLVADTRFSHPTIGALQQPGYAVRIFRLSDSDHQRMLSVRTTLAQMRADTPGQNELQLGAGIYGCLAPGYQAPDALDLLVALRITPDGDFHPIVDESTMKTADTPLSDLFWTPCEVNPSN